ncbi:accessory gene regulator B family protein [Eubacterium sp.]
MLKYLSEYITYLMIKNKILNIELYDVYVYSIQVILLNLSVMFFCFAISIVTGEIYNIISFCIFFIPIRILAGGYHCKKPRNCFVLSVLVYITPIIIAKWGLRMSLVIEILAFLSFLLLLGKVLISNDNGKLNKHQARRNKKLLNIIICLDVILYIILLKANLKIALQGAVFINIVVITIFLEKILNEMKNKKMEKV